MVARTASNTMGGLAAGPPSPPTLVTPRRSRGAPRHLLPSLEADPHFPVLEVLLLPDGNGALQRIDGELAGLEGILAMGGGNRDEHAGLADLQPSDTVEDGHALDLRPAGAQGFTDLAHLRLGHRRVRLVLEEFHRAGAGLVAHSGREDHDHARAGVDE